MKKKYFQKKKKSHTGKNQDLKTNTHFCVFSQKCTFYVSDFLLEEIVFSCYKKQYTESAMDKITFFAQWRKKHFFILVFGAWEFKKMEKHEKTWKTMKIHEKT